MEYRNLKELFSDSKYVAELLDSVCRPFGMDTEDYAIPEGWIDTKASAEITESYERLLPPDSLFWNTVKVVHDPRRPWNALSIKKNEDRNRYVLITVIPDVSPMTAMNFPIIQTMNIMSFIAWEQARSVTEACRREAQVQIVTGDSLPLLNTARIEWVSIYVGKALYTGTKSMFDGYKEPDENSVKLNLNIYEARQMEQNPLLDRLIAAYDMDAELAEGETDDGKQRLRDAPELV